MVAGDVMYFLLLVKLFFISYFLRSIDDVNVCISISLPISKRSNDHTHKDIESWLGVNIGFWNSYYTCIQTLPFWILFPFASSYWELLSLLVTVQLVCVCVGLPEVISYILSVYYKLFFYCVLLFFVSFNVWILRQIWLYQYITECLHYSVVFAVLCVFTSQLLLVIRITF